RDCADYSGSRCGDAEVKALQMESQSKRKVRARRAAQAVRLMKDEYGLPRLNNKSNAVDELIFIVLSQMTTGPSYERVFKRLKTALGTWDRLLTMNVRRVA